MIFVTGAAYGGGLGFAMDHWPDKKIIPSFNAIVQQWLDAGEDPIDQTKKMMIDEAQAVIVNTEIGCGIVPMDKDDRAFREVHGRCCCMLAQEAEEVYRVTCGIGQKIK